MRVVLGLGVVGMCAAAMLQLAAAAGTGGRSYDVDPGIEADDDGDWTYDLSTARVISPGKFTIVATLSDHPDFTRAKLKIFDALRPYCARPDGTYAIPANLLSELEQICPHCRAIEVNLLEQSSHTVKVKTSKTLQVKYQGLVKSVEWSNFLDAWVVGSFNCKEPSETETNWYLQKRSEITKNLTIRRVFDCKRGLTGTISDDIYNANAADNLRPISFERDDYLRLCWKMTHEAPYLPGK
jgi:hypothetical protein